MNNYYGYSRQPKDYSFIPRAIQRVGEGIDNLLKKVDYNKAEQAREQRITEMASEYLEATGGSAQDEEALRRATTLAMQFVPPLMGEERTNPAKGIMRIHDSDEPRWEKFIQKTKVEKYRKESQPKEEQVARALAGTQAGMVGVQDQNTQRATAWPTSREAMVQGARTESMTAPPVVPSVQSTPSSQERRQLAGQMGITDIPEVKSNIQQQEGVEAGEGWQPGQVKEQFLAGHAAAGRDITGGPVKEIGGAMQTTQQVAANKRLEAVAAQRAANDAERNRIASWRATIQQNRLTSDERRDILKSQSKNEVDRLQLSLKIKALETDIRSKTGKTDPNTFQPLISQEDAQSTYDELNELTFQLKDLEEINRDYEGLLKEKGGTATTRPGVQSAPAGARKSLSAFER